MTVASTTSTSRRRSPVGSSAAACDVAGEALPTMPGRSSATRAGSPAYARQSVSWGAPSNGVITASDLEGYDALILLIPRIEPESFPKDGRPYWLYGLAGFLALWLLFTTVHRIGPQERGVVTTLGYYSGTMRPGIGSVNAKSHVPEALYDRMEAIEFSSYIEQEKLEIAKRYLLPRQLIENGLKPNQVTITDGALSRDGISCGSCHHIRRDEIPPTWKKSPLEFFLTNSTTGQFQTGPANEIYGPFKDDEIVTLPMDNALGVKNLVIITGDPPKLGDFPDAATPPVTNDT